MSMQWKYGESCSVCKSPFGRGRCKGMCNSCYCKKFKRERPEYWKENRRSTSPKKDWDSDTYMGFTPDVTDWTRLAAYIDGEGSIGLSPRNPGKGKTLTLTGRVQVTNTDIRLPNWIAKTFGMRFYGKNSPSSRSPRWKGCFWSQALSYQACWILRNCMPWFVLKREQAEIVIAHQETMGSFVRGSGVLTPDNVVQYRLELKKRINNLNRRGPNELGSNEVGYGANKLA